MSKLHKNIHGEREKYHKFPLFYIIKEINDGAESKIEESPESLLYWYTYQLHTLSMDVEYDSMYITQLAFAEAWLFENEYISDMNDIVKFHFEQSCK